MNKIIGTNFAIDYCIFIHDSLNKNLLKIFFYEKDLLNEGMIGIQYYGKCHKIIKNDPCCSLSILDELTFCNVVNKLEEFITNVGGRYPRTIHTYENNQCESSILYLTRKDEYTFTLARSLTIFASIDKNFTWTFDFTLKQAIQLLDELKDMKKKILSSK